MKTNNKKEIKMREIFVSAIKEMYLKGDFEYFKDFILYCLKSANCNDERLINLEIFTSVKSVIKPEDVNKYNALLGVLIENLYNHLKINGEDHA